MYWKIIAAVLLLKYGISYSQFLWFMIKLYLLPKFGMKLDLKRYGSWAVVTGATDGIGKAVAKELAKRGLNIVLISRSEDKLKCVAEEIEAENVQVKTVVFDFSNSDGYGKIESELQGLDIGLLVNNVGMSYDHPDFYLSYNEKYFDDMMKINAVSVLKMTRLILDGMVKRKKGLIVHISSTSALLPVPFLSVYSATKVFVDYFGKAIQYEYAVHGIKSQVVTPHFVATKLSKLRPNSTTVPKAEIYAKQMVDAIGLSHSMTGFWSHELLIFMQSCAPYSFVMGQTHKLMNGTRKRWLRKQEQKKE